MATSGKKISEKDVQSQYQQLIGLCECQSEKSVCAKLVSPNQTVVQCMDCRADPSCIICVQCFNNGNHKGHRYIFKKAGGGCCDCGDIQAWKEEGFCNKHSGKQQDVPITKQEQENANKYLTQAYYLFVWHKLKLDAIHLHLFKNFTILLKLAIREGLKGIKIIYNFFQSIPSPALTASSKLNGTIIQQLFKDSFLTRAELDAFGDIFIEMFPYYPFKKLLLAQYIRNFSNIYSHRSTQGTAISCQIMTSYKLVQDYSSTPGAIPVIIQPTINLDQMSHLTKMMTFDFQRIFDLQGDACFLYWKLVIKNGINKLFSYYQALKILARREKEKAQKEVQERRKKEEIKDKKKKKKKNTVQSIVSELFRGDLQNIDDEQDLKQQDINFELHQFLIRNNKMAQCQHYILQQIIKIMPIISNQPSLLLDIIITTLRCLLQQIENKDDLLIFRPYQRLLGVALFYYTQQNIYILTDHRFRQSLKNAVGLNQLQWNDLVKILIERMLETFGYYSHMQTCQSSGYQTSYYVYLILYSSKLVLIGHTDILILKQLILLSEEPIIIDFNNICKVSKLQPPNQWSLTAFSGIINELGILYTGNYSQIYISFYNQKANPPLWLKQQAKSSLKKFITQQGGTTNMQHLNQFSQAFLFKEDSHLKSILKEICTYNKDKKNFELLPHLVDKIPINYKDFSLRTKINNKTSQETMPPQSTLQLIDKSNRIIFCNIWNQNNINSICLIFLKLHDEVLKSKSKEQIIQFYSILCKLEFLMHSLELHSKIYQKLSQILLNLDVSNEIRKGLGKLAQTLPILPQQQLVHQNSDGGKDEEMKKKKMKKLDQLKKKKRENLEKIKEVHDIHHMQVEGNEEQCLICHKGGGNLVWVARMSIRNLQKVLGMGSGTLTLSFTSCYHTFDEQCIKNTIKRSTHDYLFRCPVCRTNGNVFINMKGDSEGCFQRIMHVAMTMRDYSSFNIYEQVFKSFYHFVLLGFLQPNYLKQRRLKLYQKILQLLKKPSLRKTILQISQKLDRHSFVLNPFELPSRKKVNLKQVMVYQQEYSDQSYSSEDEEQIRIFQNFITAERNQQQVIKEKKRQAAMKNIEKKQKRQICNNQTPIFYFTVRTIVDHILAQKPEKNNQMEVQEQRKAEISEQALEKLQKLSKYQPQSWLLYTLDLLFNSPTPHQAQWLPPHLINLVQLPQKYYWDMGDGNCDSCGNVCQDLFICLLCKWKGCLNSCKAKGIKGHNKKYHGQCGAFLRLQQATAYLIGPGQIKTIGCLYINQWGQKFHIEKDWNQFYLQKDIYQQVITSIIRNQ